jgi:hypothetical protein
MSKYEPCAATIRILLHNTNRSQTAITALLNSAYATTDIILIQEVNITDPKYEVTHPNFLLVKPHKGWRRSNRTAAYISWSNPYLRAAQCMDICDDPDLQIFEVATDLIPPFLLLNVYNEHDPASNLYTCQDPYFHTLTNGRQRNVSLILLCSSGLALGLRPLLSSPARAILTQYTECLRSAAFLCCLLFSRFLVSSSLVFAGGLLMVLGPGDLDLHLL